VGAFPRFRASVALAFVGVACTSASVSNPVTAPPPTMTHSSGTSASTPAPPDRNPDVVTIGAGAAGSLRVRGAYPHVASRCAHPTQPELDARYPGTLTVRRAGDGTLGLTVTLPFEKYLEGIAEVPPTWPRAALEAQAIAARSYALSTTGWDGPEGATLRTPICSTTSCQVFRGIPVTATPGIRRWYAAVDRTAGQVLEDGGRPIDAVYFSTSNGHTYPNEDVFGSAPLPYLRPVVERDDGASPTSHWRVPIPFDDLARFLRAGDLWSAGTPIGSVRLAGGSIIVTGGGASRTIDVSSFDAAVNGWASCLMPARYPTDSRYGSALPTTIPSHWYSLRDGANGIVLTGRGWGHGVGMVQWGAYGKARDGWSPAKILAFYYGGLRPQPFAEPGLIHVRVADGLRSLTVVPSTKHATVDGRDVRGSIVIHGGDQLRVRDHISLAGSLAGPFTGSISRIGRELRRTLVGRNWHPGCPVPIDDLRLVRVSYHTFTGSVGGGAAPPRGGPGGAPPPRPVGLPAAVPRGLPDPPDRAASALPPTSPVGLVLDARPERLVQLPARDGQPGLALPALVRLGDRHQPAREPVREGREGPAAGGEALPRPDAGRPRDDPSWGRRGPLLRRDRLGMGRGLAHAEGLHALLGHRKLASQGTISAPWGQRPHHRPQRPGIEEHPSTHVVAYGLGNTL
jgi:SpoIID/LytB domain protein